jgi:hypothetical protein
MELVKKLFSAIEWKDLASFLSLLIGRRRIAFALITLLFSVAVLSTVFYARRVRTYQEAIHGLLRRELAPTPARYKGLEALLMSTLPEGVDQHLRDEPVDASLVPVSGGMKLG